MAVIELRQVAVKQRLQPLSFSLNGGEMLGIIGANGAGKSTLLAAIAGLVRSQGQLLFRDYPLDELNPAARARLIGYLPQSQQSAWALSVEAVVALGRLPWRDADQAAIEQALSDCQLQPLRQRRVDALSGGEQARVWLARVLAGQPQLIIADEPIASLDLRHQRNVLEGLRQHAQGQQAVMLSIHDLSLAARYCDKLCLLHQGQLLAFGSPAEVLCEERLEHAFGLPLSVNLTHNPPLIQAR